ncbi:hypothetical protein HZB01_03060 [Candidatus Woesearchaeota archaeon]|nr:hypothetical protein [Candidatus Woesearchaeota archaeon]
MVTTIQVEETTKQLLEGLKEEKKANTYDQLIREMIMKEKEIPKSMFGTAKGFNLKVERLEFHEVKLRP